MYVYQNAFEKKRAIDQLDCLPHSIQDILLDLNGASFLRCLHELSGIPGLIPDPFYRGGGMHVVEAGGKLDIHLDFNVHPELNIQRRLNAILFLNPGWREEYGGYLELWSGHLENDRHVLDRCEKRVSPDANRLIVFEASPRSYHGLPQPLNCPNGVSRRSLATYYYTAERPAARSHSTIFVKQPDEPENEHLERLRKQRAKGRLPSPSSQLDAHSLEK
jgi:Rps23 Pro-64 3,4-dihydroxylase Tpa1-like proline 4-hydroxylase